MIIRSQLRRGGVLEEPNPKIDSRRSPTPKDPPVMAHEEGYELMSEDERSFRKDFYDMFEMVKVLYNERTTRLQGKSSNQQKHNGGDGSKPLFLPPPPSPLPSPSSSSSSPSSPPSTPKHTPLSPKGHAKSPLLKLDVKFEFPMYIGEVNVEKLDNWVRQFEVYRSIQKIKDGATKIQLASLHLESATLI